MKTAYIFFCVAFFAVQCLPDEETQEVVENHTNNSNRTVSQQSQANSTLDSTRVDNGDESTSTGHITSSTRDQYHEEENQETADSKTTKTSKKSNLGLSGLASVDKDNKQTVEEKDTNKTHREYDSESGTDFDGSYQERSDGDGYSKDQENRTTAFKNTREEEDSEHTKTVNKTDDTNYSVNVLNHKVFDKNIKQKQSTTTHEEKHQVTETSEANQTYSKSHEDQNGVETQEDCETKTDKPSGHKSGLFGGL